LCVVSVAREFGHVEEVAVLTSITLTQNKKNTKINKGFEQPLHISSSSYYYYHHLMSY
jgi:hypothetical protein